MEAWIHNSSVPFRTYKGFVVGKIKYLCWACIDRLMKTNRNLGNSSVHFRTYTGFFSRKTTNLCETQVFTQAWGNKLWALQMQCGVSKIHLVKLAYRLSYRPAMWFQFVKLAHRSSIDKQTETVDHAHQSRAGLTFKPLDKDYPWLWTIIVSRNYFALMFPYTVNVDCLYSLNTSPVLF